MNSVYELEKTIFVSALCALVPHESATWFMLDHVHTCRPMTKISGKSPLLDIEHIETLHCSSINRENA